MIKHQFSKPFMLLLVSFIYIAGFTQAQSFRINPIALSLRNSGDIYEAY